MTKLTKKQKNAIEMLCLFEANANKELETNGRTEKYDSHQWMVVKHREQLGLYIAPFQQKAADRDEVRTHYTNCLLYTSDAADE